MSYPVWHFAVTFTDGDGKDYTRPFWACGMDSGDAIMTLLNRGGDNGISDYEQRYGSITAIRLITPPMEEVTR